MQIEEHNYFIKLFDTYGKLLSTKQQEVLENYLNADIAEAEIAELNGETRQSVHDAIAKAKKQLLDFEAKCGVVKGKEKLFNNLSRLQSLINAKDYTNAQSLLDDIIKNL